MCLCGPIGWGTGWPGSCSVLGAGEVTSLGPVLFPSSVRWGCWQSIHQGRKSIKWVISVFAILTRIFAFGKSCSQSDSKEETECIISLLSSWIQGTKACHCPAYHVYLQVWSISCPYYLSFLGDVISGISALIHPKRCSSRDPTSIFNSWNSRGFFTIHRRRNSSPDHTRSTQNKKQVF